MKFKLLFIAFVAGLVSALHAASCIVEGDPIANGLAGAVSSGVSSEATVTGGSLYAVSAGDLSLEARILTWDVSEPTNCDFSPRGGLMIVW